MTDRELLELLVKKVTDIDTRLERVEEKVTSLDEKVTETRLHLENVTDKNIQILAEGHAIFVSKYSKTEEISDKQYAYQVKVNYLAEDVRILKKEIEELKKQKGA